MKENHTDLQQLVLKGTLPLRLDGISLAADPVVHTHSREKFTIRALGGGDSCNIRGRLLVSCGNISDSPGLHNNIEARDGGGGLLKPKKLRKCRILVPGDRR